MKYKYKISTIIPARNEEKFIDETLSSLIKQEIKQHRILVVNDGSEDDTRNIVSKFKNVDILDIKNRGFNAQGTPLLAGVINSGLSKVKTDLSEYVMILGADHILPSNYMSLILEHMDKNTEIAICSGQINGENSVVPRGSGRIVRSDFWMRIGLQYPLNYGFETYLLVKAQQLGYKIQVLSNLLSSTKRPTRTSYKEETYISYGKSLKALGYSSLYSIARIGLIFLKNPIGALYMAKGYQSHNVNLYEEDLRKFLKSLQHKRIKKYLSRINIID